MKLLRALIPLALFAAVAVFLAMGLGLNPSEVPSPLIGKPAPAFALPQLVDGTVTGTSTSSNTTTNTNTNTSTSTSTNTSPSTSTSKIRQARTSETTRPMRCRAKPAKFWPRS